MVYAHMPQQECELVPSVTSCLQMKFYALAGVLCLSLYVYTAQWSGLRIKTYFNLFYR